MPASSSPRCSRRRTRSPPTTPATTRSPWRPCSGPGPPGSSSRASATRCTRSATREPRCSSRSPTGRVSAARTCACSRRSAGFTRRSSAARCRSTAPAPAARCSPTWGCRCRCCAGLRCLPGPRACSASWPRSSARPSPTTSTCRWTVTRLTSLRSNPHEPLYGKGAAMATVAAVIASTHHPFYLRASTSTGEDRPPFADEWVAKITAFRETLTRANPDVLVLVGSDHFHQLWLDNMPQFLVGKAPCYDANWYNEEREFGLPRFFFQGQEDLSTHILRNGIDAGFDLAFSNELRIDHSVTCPMITLRPQADLPIVPVYTNIFAPPLPQPKRYVQLGQTIRELVESWPSDQRVAVIGTGHLSLELGGPRQFGPHGPDPEFDAKAVELNANGNTEKVLAEVSLDSLWLPGNATHGFMDFMLMMGVAGENATADHVDSLDLFHTMEAYFTWYPHGVPELTGGSA